MFFSRMAKSKLGVDPKFNPVANLLSLVYFEEENCQLVSTSDRGDRLLFSIKWIYDKVPNRSNYGDSWKTLRDKLVACEDFYVAGNFCHFKKFIETTPTIAEFSAEVVCLPKNKDVSPNYDELSSRCKTLARSEKNFRKILNRLKFDVSDSTVQESIVKCQQTENPEPFQVEGLSNGDFVAPFKSKVPRKHYSSVVSIIRRSFVYGEVNSAAFFLDGYGGHFLFKIDWMYDLLDHENEFTASDLKRALRHASKFVVSPDGGYVHCRDDLNEQPDLIKIFKSVDEVIGQRTDEVSAREIFSGLPPEIQKVVKKKDSLVEMLDQFPLLYATKMEGSIGASIRRLTTSKEQETNLWTDLPTQSQTQSQLVDEKHIVRVEELIRTSQFRRENSKATAGLKCYEFHLLFKIEWLHSKLDVEFSVADLRTSLQSKDQFFVRGNLVHLKEVLLNQPNMRQIGDQIVAHLKSQSSKCKVKELYDALPGEIQTTVRGPDSLLTFLKSFPAHYRINEKQEVVLVKSLKTTPSTNTSNAPSPVPSRPITPMKPMTMAVDENYIDRVEQLIKTSQITADNAKTRSGPEGSGCHFLFKIDWLYSKLDKNAPFSVDDLKMALKSKDQFFVNGNLVHLRDIVSNQPNMKEVGEAIANYLNDPTVTKKKVRDVYDNLSPKMKAAVRGPQSLCAILKHFKTFYSVSDDLEVSYIKTDESMVVQEKHLKRVEQLIRSSMLTPENSAASGGTGFGVHFLFRIDWLHSKLGGDADVQFSALDLTMALEENGHFFVKKNKDLVHMKELISTQPNMNEVRQAISAYLEGPQGDRRQLQDVYNSLTPRIKSVLKNTKSLLTILKHFTAFYFVKDDKEVYRVIKGKPFKLEPVLQTKEMDSVAADTVVKVIIELLESSSYEPGNHELVTIGDKWLSCYQIGWIYQSLPSDSRQYFGCCKDLLDFMKNRPELIVYDDSAVQVFSTFMKLPCERAVVSEVSKILGRQSTIASNEIMSQLPNWAKKRFRRVEDLNGFIGLHGLKAPGNFGPRNRDQDLKQALARLQKKIGNDDMILRLLTALASSNVTSSGLAELVNTVEADFGKSYDDVLEIESSDNDDDREAFEKEALAEFYKLQPDLDQDESSPSAVVDLDDLEGAVANVANDEKAKRENSNGAAGRDVITKFFGWAKRSFQEM